MGSDDFFIDVDLMWGIPSPILDWTGAGGFQAWQLPAFAEMPDPNCSALVADRGVSMALWNWAALGQLANTGVPKVPYVTHGAAGYNPFWPMMGMPPAQGKWLAEFGVQRPGVEGVLPAFAFSMMPKLPLMSPRALGDGRPFYVMDKYYEDRMQFYPQVATQNIREFLHGGGVTYHMLSFIHGWRNWWLYFGIYCIVFAFVPTLLYGLYRMKADAAN